MLKILKIFLIIICFLTASLAIAADTSACMACHKADDFAQMSASDISAAVRDPGVPPHKHFADISQAELAAIAAELAGSP